ncbi:MAG: hypothetical protein ACD_49C00005G0003 [uncultured bacterium (gcode 4)]|uniref:Class I SAM-dependent methyltransferase n=1 Tax=uncultured bacterium (gcode 4) TaxID=1234023 RepID=K2AYN7_9BACT|nr:MAG: hypothetical protein ACD_49C00005G0003 [uncultured bacterium (gcode 4)]
MNLIDSKKHIPWIVFEAKDWLDEHLKSNMKVFEWGSGGSTFYFSKRVDEIVSIEYNKEWYSKVIEAISIENIKNCKYFFIEPKRNFIAKFLPYHSSTYISKTFKEYEGLFFNEYVKKIDQFPDEYFDLIFIDGRSRSSCIAHSIKKIKRGGFLMLDNSERKLYESEMKKLNKYKRIDFFGHGPYIEEEWQTSIWEIK